MLHIYKCKNKLDQTNFASRIWRSQDQNKKSGWNEESSSLSAFEKSCKNVMNFIKVHFVALVYLNPRIWFWHSNLSHFLLILIHVYFVEKNEKNEEWELHILYIYDYFKLYLDYKFHAYFHWTHLELHVTAVKFAILWDLKSCK